MKKRNRYKLNLFAAYGYKSEKNIPTEFAIGEGLVGQVAFEKERIILSNVPGNYIKISFGLGKAKPANLIILPVLFENNVKAVIELASLDTFSETHLDFLKPAYGKYRYRVEYDRSKLHVRKNCLRNRNRWPVS